MLPTYCILFTVLKNRVGNIGHSAHLGGAIGGFVFTLLLFPQILRENLLMIIFLSLPILFLLVFGKKLNV